MDEAKCALVVDDDRGSLGEIALRTLRLGVDVFYANDCGEAWLLAQQEAHQIGAMFFPPTVDVNAITRIAECLESHALDIPRALVVIGKKPNEAARARLRAAGVELALWEPYDEGDFRSVVSGAMGLRYEQRARAETRIPTTLLGRATVGVRRKDAIVATLATTGAFLETPSPFPEDTPITLEIRLPDGPLLVKCRVVYVRYPSSGEPLFHPTGMGVKFASLVPEDKERLQAFLKEIADRFEI
ncbi:MAG: PilZ domain-containing protein [Myxococcota bacterium]